MAILAKAQRLRAALARRAPDRTRHAEQGLALLELAALGYVATQVELGQADTSPDSKSR